jgi:hypothetical protein
MLGYRKRSRFTGVLFAATCLAAGPILPQAAFAGTAQIVDVEQGPTAFIGYAGAFYSGGTLASVSYSIVPKSGSVTRPFGATYSANYLNTHNYFVPGANAVVIPMFGLYAGYLNTINITYTFTDGTTNTQTTTLNAESYTDPCSSINTRTFFQNRASTSSLTYDYYLLKDFCGAAAPAILDTDGNIRWVGQESSGVSDPAFFNNQLFFSNGATGINVINLTNAQVSELADYASIGVTTTNQHNADPGRNGLLFEVNTTSETEAAAIEINPSTGAVLQSWDFGAIISAAMTAGGDNPSSFVLGTSADWVHNNALAYNPADNTLIVSSRENFVMAVDYDPPASGQRKIHWILGDTTKFWHSFPSLAKLSLTLANSSTLPPIGQHGVSIDHQGNVLLFDDGLGSLTFSPPGVTRSYSAARSYQISTSAMTATETFAYTASSGGVNLFSPICGSVYDVAGNYLVDFATTNVTAAVADAQAGDNPNTTVTALETGSGTSVILVGVGPGSGIQFVQAIPSPSPCTPGWNALPFPSNTFTFN